MCTKVRLAIFPKNLFLGQTGNLGQIWFEITLPYISWLSVRIFKNILSWWNTKCALKERYSILPKIFFFGTKRQFMPNLAQIYATLYLMIHKLLHSHMTVTYLCISSYGLSVIIKLREQMLTSWGGIHKTFFPDV